MGPFQLGTRLRFTQTFTDLISGALTDPTTVTLKLRDPNGVETAVTLAAGQIIRDSVGVYHYDFTPAVSGVAAKQWWCRWVATGTIVAASEQMFTVLKSQFTTP